MSRSIHKRKRKQKYKRGSNKFKRLFHGLKDSWADYNCPGGHRFSGIEVRKLFNKRLRSLEHRKCKDYENDNLIIDKKLNTIEFMWN